MCLPLGVVELGRDPNCWLVVDDRVASRRHAQLHVDPTIVRLEDLGSRNGTFINGQRVNGLQQLHDGDAMSLGLSTLIFTHPCVAGGPRRPMAAVPNRRASDATGVLSVIGTLIDKAIVAGDFPEADRFASVLHKRLGARAQSLSRTELLEGIEGLLGLEDVHRDGVWLGKVLVLLSERRWVVGPGLLKSLEYAVGRARSVPYRALLTYQQALWTLDASGDQVPADLMDRVGRLARRVTSRSA